MLRKRVETSHDGGVGDEDGGDVILDSPSKENAKDPQLHEEPAPPAAPPAATPVQVSAHQISAATVVNSSPPVLRGPSPESSSILSQPVRVDEDGLEHAQAVVSTLVAQLVEDEDQPKSSPSPPNPQLNLIMDQWFYRLNRYLLISFVLFFCFNCVNFLCCVPVWCEAEIHRVKCKVRLQRLK